MTEILTLDEITKLKRKSRWNYMREGDETTENLDAVKIHHVYQMCMYPLFL